jgi:hypothetical protein
MQKYTIGFMGVVFFTLSAQAVEYKQMTQTYTTASPTVIDMPYARDYVLVGKGVWNSSVENIVKNDPLFEQGNKLLSDPTLFVGKNMPVSMDPESKEKTTHIQAVADYANAIKKLSESAKTYQNPVSAYEAITMSLRLYGKGQNNPIAADVYTLTKLIYNYDVCDGYILYGEQLEKNNNKVGAYDVYKKGAANTKCTGWYQSVLGGKLSTMKRTVGK